MSCWDRKKRLRETNNFYKFKEASFVLLPSVAKAYVQKRSILRILFDWIIGKIKGR